MSRTESSVLCTESLNYVQCISFPRSGYGYFTRLVNAYFHIVGTPVEHCEYYSCCKQIPCTNARSSLRSESPKVVFAKNHDFQLSLQVPTEAQTVIIFSRDPMSALESWSEQTKDLNIGKSAIFYQKWMQKWLSYAELHQQAEESPIVIVVSYRDLIERPCDVLQKCMQTVERRHVDSHIISRAVATQRRQCNREDVNAGLKPSLKFNPRQISADALKEMRKKIDDSNACVFGFEQQFARLSLVEQFEKAVYIPCSMEEAECVVQKMYMECFDRNVDPIGKEAYVPQVMQGLLRENDLRNVLMSSQEYQEKEKQTRAKRP